MMEHWDDPKKTCSSTLREKSSPIYLFWNVVHCLRTRWLLANLNKLVVDYLATEQGCHSMLWEEGTGETASLKVGLAE